MQQRGMGVIDGVEVGRGAAGVPSRRGMGPAFGQVWREGACSGVKKAAALMERERMSFGIR